ncbi:hypothetical protein [Polaribacter sp.]|uniref:hypothetical protein n=1 Tax=Polaribacter sp. TaxID=1920175 RepID=UPI003F6A8B6E
MEFSNGMQLLDMMPTGYDWNYVSELFSSLGENGRMMYLTNQIPVDMIYPLLFGLSYCLLLGYFLKKLNKLNKLNSPYMYLFVIPIIVGIADYLENIGIITMLKSYPNLTEISVKTTSLFSLIKSMSTTAFFIILIIVLITLGLKTINDKKQVLTR